MVSITAVQDSSLNNFNLF